MLHTRPPEPFVRAFAGAYRAGGGVLADEWRRSAEAIDLCVGLAARFGSDELTRRIVETIER